MAKTKKRNKNQKKKYRPYPLTTVKFQKLATDKLRLSSAKAMEIAEKLYQKGLISYPRT
jgi:DNA topoisomerase-3